jgi:hypothetical protein
MRYLLVLVLLLVLVGSASAVERASVAPEGVVPGAADFSPTNRILSVGPNYVEILVDCYHSGHCNVCGVIDYACDAEGTLFPMPEFCPFTDPVPAGKRVTRIESHVWGLGGCVVGGQDTVAVFDVLVNGTGTGQVVLGGNCLCEECREGIGAAIPYMPGFPGYVYGGENRLSYRRISDGMCIDHVVLKIFFRDRRPREAIMPEGNPSKLPRGNVMPEGNQ